MTITPFSLRKEGVGCAPQAEATRPLIEVNFQAFRDMQLIIAEAGSDEIAWLGTLVRIDEQRYRIEEVFLFEQTVGPSFCAINPESLSRFMNEQLGDPAKWETVEQLRFWGHLHPGTMLTPSPRDDEQMKEFTYNPFFLRGILTRDGKANYTLFDFFEKKVNPFCPWRVLEDEERRSRIAAEVAAKVRRGALAREER